MSTSSLRKNSVPHHTFSADPSAVYSTQVQIFNKEYAPTPHLSTNSSGDCKLYAPPHPEYKLFRGLLSMPHPTFSTNRSAVCPKQVHALKKESPSWVQSLQQIVSSVPQPTLGTNTSADCKQCAPLHPGYQHISRL